MVSTWDSIKSYGAIGLNVLGEWGAVNGVKALGKATGINCLKSGSKMIPLIGNLVTAADDIYQQYQINSLKDIAQGLKDSQSLLQGQLSEVQFGLNEGKARSEEFSQKLTEIKASLEENSQKSAAEIKELQLQKEALENLLTLNNTNLEKLQLSQDFFLEQQQNLAKSLEILQDKTELNSAEISELKNLATSEQQKLDSLVNSFFNLDSKVTSLQNAVESLHNQHLELEQRINHVENRTEQIDQELQQLRAELLSLKTAKEKDAEKLSKLIKYQQLKVEKQNLENNLQSYLGIPFELPQSTVPVKFLDIGKLESITLEDWLQFPGYPLEPSLFDYYQNKFGESAMQNWTRSENDQYTANPVIEKTKNNQIKKS